MHERPEEGPVVGTDSTGDRHILQGIIRVDFASAVGMLVFSLACYADDGFWASGFCAGAALATLLAITGLAST